MLTNKHLVIALLVAPILAVLAWFAVGHFAGEQPQPAQVGQEYPLVEQSNCRYASGVCDLENGEFSVQLSLEQGANPVLTLVSVHSLDGVLVAVGPATENITPVQMLAADGRGVEWSVMLRQLPDGSERVRLVAVSDGSAYFGEASSAFMVEDSTGE